MTFSDACVQANILNDRFLLLDTKIYFIGFQKIQHQYYFLIGSPTKSEPFFVVVIYLFIIYTILANYFSKNYSCVDVVIFIIHILFYF